MNVDNSWPSDKIENSIYNNICYVVDIWGISVAQIVYGLGGMISPLVLSSVAVLQ